MDPDATLAIVRETVKTALAYLEIKQVNGRKLNEGEDLLDTLVEGIDALDAWLSKGGFLPARWSRENRCPDCLMELGDTPGECLWEET